MKTDQELYNDCSDWQVPEICLQLVNAYERGRQSQDNQKLRLLLPVKGVYGIHYPPKEVVFENPKTGKKYAETYERDEESRIDTFEKINNHIRDYNAFVEGHKKEIDIESQKYWEHSEINLWEFGTISAQPTLPHIDNKGKKIDVLALKIINAEKVYKKGYEVETGIFELCFNKMIYNYLKLVTGGIELTEQHIFWKPILEFENWFMMRGAPLDLVPSLIDWTDTDPVEQSAQSITELEMQKNINVVLTKKVQTLQKRIRLDSENLVKSYVNKNEFDKIIDKEYRFKKNGKINFTKLSKFLGCTDKTAKKLVQKYAPHLLKDDTIGYLDK